MSDLMTTEQSVLGGMMLSPTACEDVLETMYATDMHQPRHEIIYQAIAELFNERKPHDVIAVTDRLIAKNLLLQAGGIEYLHSLTSIVPTATSAGYYAGLVHDEAARRNLGALAASIQVQANQGADPDMLADVARRGIDEALGQRRQSLVYVGDLIEQVVKEAESPRRVMPTPWQNLTDVLGGGFRPGAFYVLAARPGIGKSALALQMAASLADSGPVAFSSLEMPTMELMRRVVSQGVEMPHHLLERGQPLPEIWKARIEAWTGHAPYSIAMDDRGGVTMSDIRAFARAVRRPSGKIAGVIVDYLQLISGDPSHSKLQIVSEVTRQMKIMAKDLDCPVIALSQLNRNPEGRIDKRPMLADLRDSGTIEQDADVVMMIYRDPADVGDPGGVPLPVHLELNVLKNRHGSTQIVNLMWEGTQMRAY